MNEDGLTSSIRDKILTITVKKGWKQGTRITFAQEGDQGPNSIPGTSPVQHTCIDIRLVTLLTLLCLLLQLGLRLGLQLLRFCVLLHL